MPLYKEDDDGSQKLSNEGTMVTTENPYESYYKFDGGIVSSIEIKAMLTQVLLKFDEMLAEILSINRKYANLKGRQSQLETRFNDFLHDYDFEEATTIKEEPKKDPEVGKPFRVT